MMLAPHACDCCRWYIPITARSISTLIRSPNSIAEDLVGPLARRHRRADHLGLPHVGLRLGHAAQAVALDPHQLLQGGRAKARRDRQLEHLRVGQLLVANLVVGERRG